MSVSKLHYLDLVDGEFSGTTPEDLTALFAAAESDPARDHLVVHFHGGLVSRNAASATAEQLLPVYTDGGAYPVFFIWNSGPLTVLSHNLDEVAREPAFQRLVRRLAQFLAGKLVEDVGTRGITIQTESLKDIPSDPEQLSVWARDHELRERKEVAELTGTQRQ